MPSKTDHHLPTVTVGVTTADYFSICRDFYMSMMDMTTFSYNHDIVEKLHLIHASGPHSGKNRNTICARREGAYTWIIDADMTFKPDTLHKLLVTAEKHANSIITGVGFMGYPPFMPALYDWPEFDKPLHPLYDWPQDKPFQIDACGGFGMFIPNHILTALGPNPFSHVPNHWKDKEATEDRELRQDLAFCMRARLAGYTIVCDPTIQFGHIRPYPVSIDDWENNKDDVLKHFR